MKTYGKVCLNTQKIPTPTGLGKCRVRSSVMRLSVLSVLSGLPFRAFASWKRPTRQWTISLSLQALDLDEVNLPSLIERLGILGSNLQRVADAYGNDQVANAIPREGYLMGALLNTVVANDDLITDAPEEITERAKSADDCRDNRPPRGLVAHRI